MVEALTKAGQDSAFLVDDFRESLKAANPVEAILLIELIADAATLAMRILALVSAKKGGI